ncbi:MAG: sugar ABC transporter ATP-binding protein [Clostridiales Family XIII bacterium]|nr:sugar ABC transporter ATP-binding protein [Clostridiales Family XIII bacterium]
MELRNVTKYFPGVVALKNMSFQVRSGEVHGLIGENGAGKSTLIKVFTGVNQPEKGEIIIDGRPMVLSNPNMAKKVGIGCIYQELNIVPDMSITDNLFINQYEKKGILLDYKSMRKKAADIMKQLGQDHDVDMLCGKLGIGVQQMVEIGKSILSEARLIIMDEPTSSLSAKEVDQLMETIKILKKKGIAIVFISHKLQEIFDICDRVTVIRDGEHISCTQVSEMTNDRLIRDMVGRALKDLFPKEETVRGEEAIRVENLKSAGVIKDVSFAAYTGEVLGFAGLVGAGRTEVMRAIFGADPFDSGSIFIRGEKMKAGRPRDAIKRKIAFMTEDRKGEGLVLDASIKNNLFLATIDKDCKYGFIQQKKYERLGAENIKTYDIKTPSLQTPVGSLSGGNQQKVVIAKWVNTDADIYIFDEPTRGIDVGAKIEIYQVINKLCREGKCVIMISSELPEILGMSDRVIVMREGRIMGETERGDRNFNSESIMKAAWGGKLS